VWTVVVPALLTFAGSRWLAPTIGSGVPGAVAAIARRDPVLWQAALFVLLSALASYWCDHFAGELRKAGVLASIAWVGVAGCAALALRTFVVHPYRVEGASMLPTLAPGDVVAGTAARRPSMSLARRGDVVVLRTDGLLPMRSGSAPPEILVKRVIGLPGDRIAMRGGSPVINGWEVPTCDAGEFLYAPTSESESAVHGRLRVEFLEDRTYLTVHSLGAPFPGTYLVEPGEVFVLGDDRSNSVDSRSLGAGRGGGIPAEVIESRVERFLVGSHRSGDADFERLLRPIDALASHLRLEGLDTGTLEDGIARCLANRPAVTRPPPAGASPSARSGEPTL